MQIVLDIQNSKTKLRRIRVEGNAVIGRGADCRLRIPSAKVSRRHCLLQISTTGATIRDLGSANGTFVDGLRIVPHHDVALKDGSELLVGPLRCRVGFAASDPALQAVAAAPVRKPTEGERGSTSEGIAGLVTHRTVPYDDGEETHYDPNLALRNGVGVNRPERGPATSNWLGSAPIAEDDTSELPSAGQSGKDEGADDELANRQTLLTDGPAVVDEVDIEDSDSEAESDPFVRFLRQLPN